MLTVRDIQLAASDVNNIMKKGDQAWSDERHKGEVGLSLLQRLSIKQIEGQPPNEELVEALKMALPYVKGAYECAFPDSDQNNNVQQAIENALTNAGINISEL